MIKEKNVKVKIHSPIYYKFDNFNKGDIVDIDIENLSKGSHVKITAICDVCGAEKMTMYKTYLKMTKDDKKYYCLKCRKQKIKETNIIKYGVENVMQLDEIKEKMYKTNLNKYGNICSLHNVEIKDKTKKTCLVKYGNENPNSSDIIKNKKMQTCLNKYDVKNVMNDKHIMNKMINTMFEKYGDYFNREKIRNTKLKNGTIIPDDQLSDWQIYKKIVTNLTKHNKKVLLENWNGTDYYDGEYIKNNFNLKPYDRLYPTIDHKISIYYGFVNNIRPEEISNINNLCLTKKHINSTKNTKNKK